MAVANLDSVEALYFSDSGPVSTGNMDGSGSDRAITALGIASSYPAQEPTGITWDGGTTDALSFLGEQDLGFATNEFYGLAGTQSDATASLTMTLSGYTLDGYLSGASYTGVDSLGATDNILDTSSPAQLAPASVAADDMVSGGVMAGYSSASIAVSGTGHTQRQYDNSQPYWAGMLSDRSGSDGTTLDYTFSGASDGLGGTAVRLVAVSAAVASLIFNPNPMRVHLIQ